MRGEMGNAVPSCSPLSSQLAAVSPVPAPPSFSLCCSCPSPFLVPVILPPANSYSVVMLFNPSLPALLRPPCCPLPLTIVGPTSSQHRSRCQLDVEQGGVGVTSSGRACRDASAGGTGAGAELLLCSVGALPLRAWPRGQRASSAWGQPWQGLAVAAAALPSCADLGGQLE